MRSDGGGGSNGEGMIEGGMGWCDGGRGNIWNSLT